MRPVLRASCLAALFVLSACPKKQPTLSSVTFTPDTVRVARGDTVQCTATALYDDGSVHDVTADGLWSVDDAVIGEATDVPGAIRGLQTGETVVRLRYGGKNLTRALVVGGAAIRELQLDPPRPVVPVGLQVTFTLTAIDSDGVKTDMTEEAVWMSSAPEFATVDDGVVTGQSVGSATISASLRGLLISAPVDVSDASVRRIDVQPPSVVLPRGLRQSLTATALLSDGSSLDVTRQARWTSSKPEVVVASELTEEAGWIVARLAGEAQVTATLFAHMSSAEVTVTNATLEALELSPPTAVLARGTTASFVAIGRFSDGTTSELTAQADWNSSDPRVLTVEHGLVRGVAAGQATLSAQVGNVEVHRVFTVSDASLASLEIEPTPLTVPVGVAVDARVVGRFSDGSQQELTSTARWSVSNPALASVSNALRTSGRVTALREGDTELVATVGMVSVRAALHVSGAALRTIQVSPATASLPLGSRLSFVAMGLFSDGTTHDLTSQVTWTSTDAAKVSISNQQGSRGEARALALGTAELTATANGRSGVATVTVTAAMLVQLDVSPMSPTLPLGTTVTFAATGVYSDATVRDLTDQVTWSVDDAAVADLSNAPGTHGLARALTQGTVQVTAQLGTTRGHTTLTVSPAAPTRLEVSPATVTVAKGLTRDFTVMATFTDATTLDVTAQTHFTSSAPTVATVSNLSGSLGTLTARAAGAAVVTADALGLTARSDVTVTPAVPVTLSVSQTSMSLSRGTSGQLHAQATLSDGSSVDVTTQVTWSSDAPTKASVSNAPGDEGHVQALELGTAVVQAQLGTLTASLPVTVTPAVLVALELTPAPLSLPVGASTRVTATGRFSDNTAQDLSTQVAWSSNAPTVLSVSNASGDEGHATALTVGQARLDATLGSVVGHLTVTVTPASLQRVELTPLAPRIAKDTQLAITATGVWSDGTTQTLTEQCAWASATTGVATISNSPGQRGLMTGTGAGTSVLSATCTGVVGTVTATITDATLVSIQLEPASPTAAAGFTASLSATGVFSDGTSQPLTTFVNWASDSPTIATVSNLPASMGVVQARAAGTAIISATALGVTGTTSFVVSAALLQRVELTPAVITIPLGFGQSFDAVGHFSDGTTSSVAEAAVWTSSAPSIASVSNATGTRGRVSTLREGVTTLSATVGGFSATATLTVSPAVLASIDVTPAAPSLAKGLLLPLTATGTYSDGSTRDLTSVVTWSTSQAAVATVSNASGTRGEVRAVATGTSNLSAALGSISGSTLLTVTPAILASVSVAPQAVSLPLGLSSSLSATGVYSDGSTADLTSQATWMSSAGSKVDVSNSSGSSGSITALALGSSTVSASFGGFTGTTTVTVIAAVLQSITLTPPNPSVPAGLTVTLTATGLFSDSTTQDLTSSTTWQTSNAALAVASAGVVTGRTVGSVTVMASSGGISGSTTVQVTAAVLQQLQVTPANTSRPKGLIQQFTATGVFSDASTSDLTTSATWASSNPSRVAISNASGSEGRATTPGVGAVTISATILGISGSTPFTVTPAVLSSVSVSPSSGTAPLGSVRQYHAIGTYTDSSSQLLTTQATWSSSDPSVASVSNANGSQGLATTLRTGSTSVTATFSGLTGAVTLTVIQTVLTRIDITPANGSTALGYTRQFIAIGTYTGGTTQVITDSVTWTSSDEAVAIVSNANGSRGLLSSVGVGALTVSATLNGITGTTGHTISPAVLVAMNVTPGSLSLTAGANVQLHADGFFSDGTLQDVTAAVTWSSTAPAVVQVSNASGSEGLVSAIASGSAAITGTLDGVTTSNSVSVQ